MARDSELCNALNVSLFSHSLAMEIISSSTNPTQRGGESASLEGLNIVSKVG